jgi:hypothetical protein
LFDVEEGVVSETFAAPGNEGEGPVGEADGRDVAKRRVSEAIPSSTSVKRWDFSVAPKTFQTPSMERSCSFRSSA